MSIELDDVHRIARLARLAVNDADARRYALDLNQILELVRRMSACDTEGVEPLTNPLDARQRMRPDEVSEVNERERFQRAAPAAEDGLYLVPKVIE